MIEMAIRHLEQSDHERLRQERRCACGKRYYDMNRVPVACPDCGRLYKEPGFAEVLTLVRARPLLKAEPRRTHRSVRDDAEDGPNTESPKVSFPDGHA